MTKKGAGTAMEYKSGATGPSTKASGKEVKPMVTGDLSWPMVTSMKALGHEIKPTDGVSTTIQMELATKESG